MPSCYQVLQTICHTANKRTIFIIFNFFASAKLYHSTKGKNLINFPKLLQLLLKKCEKQFHP